MAIPAQRTNTWTLDEWYDQAVAGTTGGYQVSKELYAWGANHDGQLAQNNLTLKSSPVQVPGTTWSVLGSTSSVYGTCYAIKQDGTFWAWGSNSSYGLVGNSSSTNVSSPIQLPGTTWKAVFGGRNTALASKTDGTLWNWGYNPEGGLGQNNRTAYSSPKQLGAGTDWVGTTATIAAGEGSQAAIKTDGTLWTWGQSYRGETAHNNRVHSSSPTQIPGTTWRDVKIGGRIFLATKTDGTLWTCGAGYQGALAQNSETYYSSPVQIPGTAWRSVGDYSYSGYAAFATKTDNTLWAWGYNAFGALGQNEQGGPTSRSSPTQIPGTNWEHYAVGFNAGTRS